MRLDAVNSGPGPESTEEEWDLGARVVPCPTEAACALSVPAVKNIFSRMSIFRRSWSCCWDSVAP